MGEWPTWLYLLVRRHHAISAASCSSHSFRELTPPSSRAARCPPVGRRWAPAAAPSTCLAVSPCRASEQVLAGVREAMEGGGPEGLLFQLQIVLLPRLPCSLPPAPRPSLLSAALSLSYRSLARSPARSPFPPQLPFPFYEAISRGRERERETESERGREEARQGAGIGCAKGGRSAPLHRRRRRRRCRWRWEWCCY